MHDPAAGDTVRVMGIDPGSRITGFGILDVRGSSNVLVEWGVVQTAGDHGERLKVIFNAVMRVVQEFQPTEIAIERVFLHRNPDSALKLGQARAAALCGTFGADIPVYEYTARHIKKAVVGRGGAEKYQVQHMVRTILALRTEIAPDAADALATALCHAHERGARGLREQLAGQS